MALHQNENPNPTEVFDFLRGALASTLGTELRSEKLQPAAEENKEAITVFSGF